MENKVELHLTLLMIRRQDTSKVNGFSVVVFVTSLLARADDSLEVLLFSFLRCLTSHHLKSFLSASVELFNSLLPLFLPVLPLLFSFALDHDRSFSKEIILILALTSDFLFLTSHLPRRTFTLVLNIWQSLNIYYFYSLVQRNWFSDVSE